MTRLKHLLQPEIPTLPKAFGWVLVLAGLFFAYVYMMAPGMFFPAFRPILNSSAFTARQCAFLVPFWAFWWL